MRRLYGLLVLALLATPTLDARAEEHGEASAVAGRINAETILISEIDKEITTKPQYEQMRAVLKTRPEEIIRMRPLALNAIITQRIVNTLMAPQREELKKKIQPALAHLLEEFEKESGRRDEYLASQHLTLDEFKRDVEQDLLVRAYVDQQVAASITPEELKDAYVDWSIFVKSNEAVKASEILIKVPEKASPEELAKIQERVEKIYQQAIAPDGDFFMLALKESEGSGKKYGGYLGRVRRGMSSKEFDEIAFSMQDEEVSAPILTSEGYAIIKVHKHVGPRLQTFEEAKQEIENSIISTRRRRFLEKAVADAWEKSTIKIEIPDPEGLFADPAKGQPA